jgi:hypothetical protein
MKKITAVFLSLLCVVSVNLAFAGSSMSTAPKQPIAEKPRFQR